jgi:predicted RNA-binding protein
MCESKVFGEQQHVRGKLVTIDLLNHRVVLEPIS